MLEMLEMLDRVSESEGVTVASVTRIYQGSMCAQETKTEIGITESPRRGRGLVALLGLAKC